jgi:hypothetical protein
MVIGDNLSVMHGCAVSVHGRAHIATSGFRDSASGFCPSGTTPFSRLRSTARKSPLPRAKIDVELSVLPRFVVRGLTSFDTSSQVDPSTRIHAGAV